VNLAHLTDAQLELLDCNPWAAAERERRANRLDLTLWAPRLAAAIDLSHYEEN
jgi:hypothetical protein